MSQINTLVQNVGPRPFEISDKEINNTQLLILTFPSGLTLLMPHADIKRPTENGVAKIDVHRKFLPTFGKYLHWIVFTFPKTGNQIKAQIMKQDRLEASYNLIHGGASACFISNPYTVHRQSHINKRRIRRTIR